MTSRTLLLFTKLEIFDGDLDNNSTTLGPWHILVGFHYWDQFIPSSTPTLLPFSCPFPPHSPCLHYPPLLPLLEVGSLKSS